MLDLRIKKLAHTIVGYSVNIQPSETVALHADISGMPLFTEIYKEVIRVGGLCIPLITNSISGVRLFGDGSMNDFFLRHANNEQMKWISPLERWLAEDVDIAIIIRSTTNTRRHTNIVPERLAVMTGARRHLMKRRFKKFRDGTQRSTSTIFPTEANAQEADMSLEEYEDLFYRATFSDKPDPIECWKKLYEEQQRYVDWFQGHRKIEIRGSNIEMAFSIEDRFFYNSGGTHNMPSGEIFTGPVEESVNGWVRFTYPAIHGGRQIDGIELKFEGGKVIEAKASKNERYLLRMLNIDEGARHLGEFAIGTNYGIDRFVGDILLDEKMGGTIHFALGQGYPQTGSKNESAIHWDLIYDMRNDGEIIVDNEIIYKNGFFMI